MKINKQKFYEVVAQRSAALDAAEQALVAGNAEEYTTKMAEVESFNGQLQQMKAFLEERGKQPAAAPGAPGVEPEGESNGYANAVKAFAAAARAGFKAATGSMNETTGADGGYTVPEDISTKIIQLRDAKESLLGEVTVEPVKTKSGKRTYQKRSQHEGFATVEEAAKVGKAATPQFATEAYEIEKRSGYLPVTNELLEDSDNNIASVVETWLADEARVTANKEILAEIAKNPEQDLKDLDGILSAWILLGSVFRATSKLYTNDDGLLWLSLLKDSNGRALLSPNPTQTAQMQLCIGAHILPIKTYDNKTMPTKDGKIPMIIGDLKEGIKYWDRKQFSVRVFDSAVIGDFNAAEQDLTLWKGSLRDDCTLRDDEAFINGYIQPTNTNAGQTGGSDTTQTTPAG